MALALRLAMECSIKVRPQSQSQLHSPAPTSAATLPALYSAEPQPAHSAPSLPPVCSCCAKLRSCWPPSTPR